MPHNCHVVSRVAGPTYSAGAGQVGRLSIMFAARIPAALRAGARVPLRTLSTPSVRLASTLVFVEHKNGKINPSTLSAVTAAQKVGGEVDALVLAKADEAKTVAEQAAKISGLSKVLMGSGDVFANQLAEPIAPVLKKILAEKSYSHFVAGHSAVGRDIVPRVSALLDASQISDIIEVNGEKEFTRPIYAGNALATVKTNDGTVVFTVRGTAFDAAQVEGGSASVEEVDVGSPAAPTTFIKEVLNESSRPDLATAPRVVSGGRALKSSDGFAKYIEPLADKLNAAVGASRAAVDSGYADNALQVGQTGKIVAPELYVAVGISGAIQHLAGMKDSKTIVAINKVRWSVDFC